ncbi:BnaC05g44760D [Brassica napus]|uniref:BnaC05g44760D protein n=1 Tax=Brassica napus TaxID=3708 RepID=A0A078GSD2_BRANA|nr:BnaC05g44760D [Brassica napus]
MLISHDSLDVNDASKSSPSCLPIHGKGARRRRIRHTTILSTIGEARARAWQVATPPVAIGQGMYISVFGAREPETGRILALKKARGSKRYMQDVNACVLN